MKFFWNMCSKGWFFRFVVSHAGDVVLKSDQNLPTSLTIINWASIFTSDRLNYRFLTLSTLVFNTRTSKEITKFVFCSENFECFDHGKIISICLLSSDNMLDSLVEQFLFFLLRKMCRQRLFFLMLCECFFDDDYLLWLIVEYSRIPFNN